MTRFVLGAALGVLVGWIFARALAPEPRAAVAAAPARCAAHLGVEDLAALRIALAPPAAAVQAMPAEQASAPQAPVEPAPDPQAPAKIAAADALVEHALAAGEWTEDDVAHFRALAVDLPAAERQRAMTAVLTAVNAQRLRPTTHVLF